MSDGTVYETISLNGCYSFRSKKYDQIIYADDNRWRIFNHLLNLDYDIFRELQHTMVCSCVPEEFQYLKYELE